MVAIFIMVTLLVSGKKSLVNMAQVMQVQEIEEENGSVLFMMDGRKLQIRETLEDISMKTFDENVKFQSYAIATAEEIYERYEQENEQ